MNLVKLPFLLVNFLFLCLSLTLLGFGIFILTDETIVDRIISLSNLTEILKISSSEHELKGDNSTAKDNHNNFRHVTDPISFLFISVGALLFILSFIGYCGAVKDSRCLVATFGMVLTLIYIAEVIGLCLYFFMFKPDIKTYLSEGIKKYYSPEPRPSGVGTRFTVIMDYIMIEHKCCGINGDTDFHEIYEKHHRKQFAFGLDLKQRIPEACCDFNLTNFKEVNEIYSNILMSTYPNYEAKESIIRTRKELLDFSSDRNCHTGWKSDTAFLGEENGCFDKIQMDWSTLIILSAVVIGLLQLSGIAFSVLVFRAAYYDFHG